MTAKATMDYLNRRHIASHSRNGFRLVGILRESIVARSIDYANTPEAWAPIYDYIRKVNR